MEGQSVPPPVPSCSQIHSRSRPSFGGRVTGMLGQAASTPRAPPATWRALPVICRRRRDGGGAVSRSLFILGASTRSFPWLPTQRARSIPGAEISHSPHVSSCGDCAAGSLPNVPTRTILPLGPLVASCRLLGARAGRPAQAGCQNADARPSGRLSLPCPCRLSARPRTGSASSSRSSGLAVAAGLG